jgi:hypothetical protein
LLAIERRRRHGEVSHEAWLAAMTEFRNLGTLADGVFHVKLPDLRGWRPERAVFAGGPDRAAGIRPAAGPARPVFAGGRSERVPPLDQGPRNEPRTTRFT